MSHQLIQKLLEAHIVPCILFHKLYSNTVRFIKPHRNPVYKCTGLRQGLMKWALFENVYDKNYFGNVVNSNNLSIPRELNMI